MKWQEMISRFDRYAVAGVEDEIVCGYVWPFRLVKETLVVYRKWRGK